jgi:hypothetical protein
MFVIGVLGLLWMAMIGTLVVVAIMQRPYTWSFSMRTMLGVMTLIAILLGTIVWLSRAG